MEQCFLIARQGSYLFITAVSLTQSFPSEYSEMKREMTELFSLWVHTDVGLVCPSTLVYFEMITITLLHLDKGGKNFCLRSKTNFCVLLGLTYVPK